MGIEQGPWFYCFLHQSACRVIEEQTLWGQTVCRIWLPNQNAVVRVPRTAVRPLNFNLDFEIEAARIGYMAAAAKVAEVLEGSASASGGQVLLAAMESNVTPLPHQIHALSRAISGDRVRYLLADEVGLGKTIEAGLVMRELKLRGLVRRILIVAPKALLPSGWRRCRPISMSNSSLCWATISAHCRVWLPGLESKPAIIVRLGRCSIRSSCRSIRSSPWTSGVAGLPSV